jgi:uncharacterized protein (DUF433 family)
MSVKAQVIHSDPDILGGTPVFAGTRVPVKILLDYLEAGDRLDEFLDHFPSVTREQAIATLELAKEMLTNSCAYSGCVSFPWVGFPVRGGTLRA